MSVINSITGSNAATATTTAASTTTAAMGKDDFLKMLIAQLKNQDPTNPQQGAEFAAQLAQFSSVEQLTNVNTALKSQNQNSLNLMNAQAINLIGKEITAQTAAGTDGTPGAVITGPVTAVSFKDQTASLTVNGKDIPFTALLSVRGLNG
jgi:flagellar basal-body rod modification protein FlgD